MRKTKIILTALAVSLLLAGCGNSAESTESTKNTEITSGTSSTEAPVSSAAGSETVSTEPGTEENKMKMIINGTEFSAAFSNTKAAEEFKAMLPLTLDMSELNGNEKYIYLDERLTAESENVGQINSGDIMLYGSDCIVLFTTASKQLTAILGSGRSTTPTG